MVLQHLAAVRLARGGEGFVEALAIGQHEDRVVLGVDQVDRRRAGRQPRVGRRLGRERGVCAIVGARVGDRLGIEWRHDDRRLHPGIFGTVQLGVRDIVLDVVGAGRVAPENDTVRISPVLSDVSAGPGHGGPQILGAGRPGILGGQAVVDIDADHAVVHRPSEHVVGLGLVTADKTAAVDEDHHRPGRPLRRGLEDIDLLQRVRSGGHVARDGDAGQRILGVVRGVQRADGQVDRPRGGLVLGGDLGRDLRLGCREDGEAGGQGRGSDKIFGEH